VRCPEISERWRECASRHEAMRMIVADIESFLMSGPVEYEPLKP
jgi:hypothetical protein